LNLTFYHVPGETEDHIAIWVPAQKALMIGDNLYKMFPNLYAIRGTPVRDPLKWCNSLRKLRKIGAEYLIPSHGPIMSGQQAIFDLLTSYSAAIQYVHDQTVHCMNQFMHPDEIARSLQLPPSLASNPYLRQQYGRVDWSSKAVYQRYVGWFSGDAVELLPVTPAERAQRMLNMIGLDR
jgi:alkyl sulfatase BDS1-like metallo-beta-lactamase superfamily hydrolase